MVLFSLVVVLVRFPRCDYTLPRGTSPGLVSLVEGLLNRDPAQRTHSLHALQKEQIYSNMDLATVVEKKVIPTFFSDINFISIVLHQWLYL